MEYCIHKRSLVLLAADKKMAKVRIQWIDEDSALAIFDLQADIPEITKKVMAPDTKYKAVPYNHKTKEQHEQPIDKPVVIEIEDGEVLLDKTALPHTETKKRKLVSYDDRMYT